VRGLPKEVIDDREGRMEEILAAFPFLCLFSSFIFGKAIICQAPGWYLFPVSVRR